ncbi:MAG: hypothetical protein ACJATI_002310 [Halioglobus sp.]|jgi:hypothetical protein
MREFIIIGLLFIFASCISAQTSFYNATQEILGQQRLNSTVAIAVDDINGDYKDDLILFDQGKFLKTFTQTSSNTPFIYKLHTQTSAFGEWAVVSGDLNNDGTPEIVASGNENGSEILFFNNETYSTVQATPSVYSQNTNLVDLNNDGFLDLFVCNDVGENQTYINDGDGKMIKEIIIDFMTSDEDDMSGNYSSIFTDIDSDGDLDLYIGKCRGGVTDPTDRRRINTLYINNNDGTYSERAEEFGLANGSQTWSVDAGDVDNDGDIDILIANHDREHDLMLNDGDGHFLRFGGLPPESKSFAYQSFFADFDNNGWLDIFITEPSKSYILYNNEMKFSQYDVAQGGKKAFSGATGDFNSDGYLDLYLGFAGSFQSPGSQSDVVALNEGGVNNYLDINLVGAISNKDAIGGKVSIFYQGGSQIREITAGKSYGIMNSTVAHFGLGNIEFVDSIIVYWPSGLKTILDNLYEANNFMTIIEAGCVTTRLKINDYEICTGDAATIFLDEEYDSYLWSDGSTGISLITTIPGSYSVVVAKNGCLSGSDFFIVKKEEDYQGDELIYADQNIACENSMVSLETINGLSYEWSNGQTSREITVSESGTYTVTVSTNCETYISDEFEVDFVQLSEEEITEDTVFIGEQSELSLTGDNVNWYREFYDYFSVYSGNDFTTVPLFRDSIFYAGNTIIDAGESTIKMSPVPLNSTFDNQFIGNNDTLEFKVLSPFVLKSVSVRTQVAGKRIIEIWKDRILVKTIEQEMGQGKNVISINLRFKAGDYRITTNRDNNITELDSEGPIFSYSDQFIGFDKVVPGYLKIGESTTYDNVTPYFFDWDINYGSYSCENRYAVKATVKEDVSTTDTDFLFKVYPNPSNGLFTIDTELYGTAEIWTVGGKRVIQSSNLNEGKNTISTDLSTGMYVLRLIINNHVISEVLIIE